MYGKIKWCIGDVYGGLVWGGDGERVGCQGMSKKDTKGSQDDLGERNVCVYVENKEGMEKKDGKNL